MDVFSLLRRESFKVTLLLLLFFKNAKETLEGVEEGMPACHYSRKTAHAVVQALGAAGPAVEAGGPGAARRLFLPPPEGCGHPQPRRPAEAGPPDCARLPQSSCCRTDSHGPSLSHTGHHAHFADDRLRPERLCGT